MKDVDSSKKAILLEDAVALAKEHCVSKTVLAELLKNRPKFVLFSKETEMHGKRGIIQKYEDFLEELEGLTQTQKKGDK